MSLNKTLVALVCVFLVAVQLGYSFGLWERMPANLFCSDTSSSNWSSVEEEWSRLHNVKGTAAVTTLREQVAKGVLPYDDLYLINYVRQKLLVFPDRSPSLFVRVDPPKNYSQLGQDKIIDKLLNHRTNGFFIEAGAHDGQTFSNTLFLEKERNWTGLLVEADPNLFRLIKGEKRQAYSSNTCLSTSSYAMAVNFTFADALGGIKPTDYKNEVTGTAIIQCIPLITYLLALNIRHVDYFSLDVEGTEIEVLKQIDFNRFQFDVLTIEYAVYGHPGNESAVRLKEIRQIILGTNLYYEVSTIGHQDVIFMRNATSV
jgi:FkbM family methyltransferase